MLGVVCVLGSVDRTCSGSLIAAREMTAEPREGVEANQTEGEARSERQRQSDKEKEGERERQRSSRHARVQQ